MHCDDFLKTAKVKKVHNFVRHYDQGKNIASEDRPVSVQSFDNILSYKISYSQHKEFNDFESP